MAVFPVCDALDAEPVCETPVPVLTASPAVSRVDPLVGALVPEVSVPFGADVTVAAAAYSSELVNEAQFELAGTRAVYGIDVIAPRLSGGCWYVVVTPFWT